MRKRLFSFALVLGLILMSACAGQVKNEPTSEVSPTPTPSPVSTPTPSPVSTPTPTPLPEIAVAELPEADFLLYELYPEEVTKIELEVLNGYDKVFITVEDEQIISEFMNAIGDAEITVTYEPLFLECEHNVRLSLYLGDSELISFDEDASYGEFIVKNVKHKKTYAVKDEKIRKSTVMMNVVESMFSDYVLTLNNGKYDIDFVPLHVENDGYVLTSELGLYAWPVFNFETIDFSGYTLSIGDEIITEFPEESGEYILVVTNDAGEYQIKIYVE